MIITYSVNGVPIRLTNERWEHIIFRHPELREEKEKVLETLVTPQFILEGDFGTLLALKHYAKTPLTSKFMVVVYKEINTSDGFILTAYFTNQSSEQRKTLWKQ